MKFFNYLDNNKLDKIFYIKPSDLSHDTPRDLLSYALGATLYMPGTRKDLKSDLMKFNPNGLMTAVVCNEDAIGDGEVLQAEQNCFDAFEKLEKSIETEEVDENNLPFVFMRVKNIMQFERIACNIDKLSLLCGFVFPKFSAEKDGEKYFEILSQVNLNGKKKFYAMPILESPEIIHRETRLDELIGVKNILDKYRDYVLNVRIGATDLSGLYAIRREFEQTVYDIAVISDCIADIVNIFLRSDSGYVVSGPVWEYFSSGNRILKPMLRQHAFTSEMGEEGLVRRKYMIDQYMDGLIKETLLDRANGLNGKTVIHPSHISVVNALQVVTKEEYEDATMILSSNQQGAQKSAYGNKMNEPKPHYYWAEKIIKKSKIYGVLNEGRNYTSLFI